MKRALLTLLFALPCFIMAADVVDNEEGTLVGTSQEMDGSREIVEKLPSTVSTTQTFLGRPGRDRT